jgi:hypothetical protein
MTLSISYPPSSTAFIKSWPMHFYLLTWKTSLYGRKVVMVVYSYCSFMQALNVWVNLLTTFGSLIRHKLLCTKVLTWSSTYVIQMRLHKASVRVEPCNSSWHYSYDSCSSQRNIVCLHDSYTNLWVVHWIYSCTWHSTKDLYVAHYSSLCAHTSSNKLYVTYCTSSRIYDTYSNLCITLSTSS